MPLNSYAVRRHSDRRCDSDPLQSAILMRTRLFLPWLLAVSYFGTWYGFAALYQRAATSSRGRAFIFQDQLRLESQISALRQGDRAAVSEEVARRVILASSNRTFEFRPRTALKNVTLALPEPLGKPWGAYYLALAASKGLTHFSVEVREFVEEPDRRQYPVRLTFYRHHVMSLAEGAVATEYYRMWFWDAEDPSATHIYAVPKPDQVRLWQRAGTLNFTADRDPRPMTHEWTAGLPPSVRTVGIYPLPLLEPLIETSITDPDGSVHRAQEIVNGDFRYAMSDFLYFSAITIATVGYGDILPNSQHVRRLVMIEALLGVVLAGAFVASLFSSASRGTRRFTSSSRGGAA